ncbi:MAG: YggS family pyridoxal phosphate-dependent enzyme, partial [Acidobacteriota bacterium]
MQHISENLVSLRAKVAEAAEQAGRSPEEIRILAISKTFPAESVRLAAAAGQVQFGENRIQEARTKIPEVNLPDLEWHMVGHLQSNKVRLAVQLFEVIQSVDSERIARKIDQVCSEQDKIQSIFIQVNVGDEIQKAGVPVEKVAELVEIVDELPHLSLQGLMAIPPYD